MVPPIVPAQERDAHYVAAVLAIAAMPLPLSRWLVGKQYDRQRVLYASIRILVDHAITYGHVLTTEHRAGAAVWLPRDTPLPQIPDQDEQLTSACGVYADRFRLLDEALTKHHPERPHHHLALLGVDPARHRRGLGSALLDRYHTELDAAGMPAYATAFSPRSRSLYAGHGYADLGDPIDLPKSGPRLWPMWRPPGQRPPSDVPEASPAGNRPA